MKNSKICYPTESPRSKELIPYLEKIWKSKIISNNGPFHEQLEMELSKHLNVPHIS